MKALERFLIEKSTQQNDKLCTENKGDQILDEKVAKFVQ